MSEEKISVTRAARGIVEPKNYIKAGVFSVNIGIMVVFVFGVISIFNHFFGKTNQTQTSNLTIEKGAQVETLVLQNTQSDGKKTVSLEFTASSQDAGIMFKRYINSKWHVGIGGRWDFQPDEDELPVKPEVRLGVDF